MLIGNYNVFSKSCGSFTSGPSLSDDRGNWNKSGKVRNRYLGWDAGTLNQLTTIPDGYGPGYTWIIANKTGGMAARSGLVGSGAISGGLAGGLNAAAALTGTGDVSNALLGLIVSAVAALSGSGALAADIKGILGAAASLSGSGAVAADILAKASIMAALSGTGAIAVDAEATADISADIVVTGELLSTANVGDAVWGSLLEAGFSADQILRIIAAAVAGASSGGPDTPTFRNLSDSQDQIVGSADSSGNRTDITYGD